MTWTLSLRQSDQCDALPKPGGVNSCARATGVNGAARSKMGIGLPMEDAKDYVATLPLGLS